MSTDFRIGIKPLLIKIFFFSNVFEKTQKNSNVGAKLFTHRSGTRSHFGAVSGLDNTQAHCSIVITVDLEQLAIGRRGRLKETIKEQATPRCFAKKVL